MVDIFVNWIVHTHAWSFLKWLLHPCSCLVWVRYENSVSPISVSCLQSSRHSWFILLCPFQGYEQGDKLCFWPTCSRQVVGQNVDRLLWKEQNQKYTRCNISKGRLKKKTRTTIVVSNGRYSFYQIHFIKHILSNTIYQIPFIKYHLELELMIPMMYHTWV